MYNLQSGLFFHSLASTTPFSPKPKMPFTYVVYVCSGKLLSKGHLGSGGGGGGGGGGASENKLKDTSFIFPITNFTILSIFINTIKLWK